MAASDPQIRPRVRGYLLPIFLNYIFSETKPKVWNSGATRPHVAGSALPTAGGFSAPDLRGGF